MWQGPLLLYVWLHVRRGSRFVHGMPLDASSGKLCLFGQTHCAAMLAPEWLKLIPQMPERRAMLRLLLLSVSFIIIITTIIIIIIIIIIITVSYGVSKTKDVNLDSMILQSLLTFSKPHVDVAGIRKPRQSQRPLSDSVPYPFIPSMEWEEAGHEGGCSVHCLFVCCASVLL